MVRLVVVVGVSVPLACAPAMVLLLRLALLLLRRRRLALLRGGLPHPPTRPPARLPLLLPLAGTNWVRNVLTTTMLFCGPLLAMFSYLNTVAWAYGTTAALPFGTIVIIVVIWALVTFPLTVVGGIMGKNTKVGGWRAGGGGCGQLAVGSQGGGCGAGSTGQQQAG